MQSVVGPFAGALVAVAVAWLLRGGTTRYAMAAAMGELLTRDATSDAANRHRRGESA